MVGEIIDVTNSVKGKDVFEVIKDIEGPEKISVDMLEIVPLREGGLDLLDFLVISPKYQNMLSVWDLRDRAKEMDAHLGLQHARCIMRAQQEVPKEWHKYNLLFPGTIARAMRDGKLYLPVLLDHEGDFFLGFLPLVRQEWSQQTSRFVRWRR